MILPVVLILSITTALDAQQSATQYPDFKFVASEWPSVELSAGESTGYADIPKYNQSFVQPFMDLLKAENAFLALKTGQSCSDNITQMADSTCWWTCSSSCFRETDVIECGGEKTIGLTFDDGPGEHTLELLDYLQQHKLKATFFLVGAHVVQNPDIIRKLHEAGMELGVHTWSHHPLTTETSEQVIAEILWTVLALQKILGKDFMPKYMRPPFGDIDDRVREIVKVFNMKPVMWNIDTNDWTITDANDKTKIDKLVKDFKTTFLSQNHPKGLVILEHDMSDDGATLAMTKFIPFYVQQGYKMMSVGQCESGK